MSNLHFDNREPWTGDDIATREQNEQRAERMREFGGEVLAGVEFVPRYSTDPAPVPVTCTACGHIHMLANFTQWMPCAACGEWFKSQGWPNMGAGWQR